MCVLCPPPTPAHVCISTRGERTLLGRPARLPFFFILRPAGGVKHSDLDLVEIGVPSAKKHFDRWIEGSILSNSKKF